MTVALAALVGVSHIVTVSDARLSYGEMIPAEDAAIVKSRRIGRKWGMLFAAEDATAFLPVVHEVQEHLMGEAKTLDEAQDHAYEIVSKTVRDAYEKEFSERFFREHLARFGYTSIADFRQAGFVEMGKDLYHQYSMELAKFDLGLELLVYGFNKLGNGFVFEVHSPGKVILQNLRGYAAIGSGSLMALAALSRKPKTNRLSETVYRLLDAKFSSETAREVGKATYVIILQSDGTFKLMKQPIIEQIREIWLEEQKVPDPSEALGIIDEEESYKIRKSGQP
jgi:hypothetical protein